MNYCSNCGRSLSRAIPPGDDRWRYVCESCGAIHYQNPKVVVGSIPLWKDRILMCRRAIEPCSGLWTLPAGYLENGETVADGARREAQEEARVAIHDLKPYALYNLCFVNQIYLLFRSRLKCPEYGAGQESLEVKLFSRSEIPWDQIAFEVIRDTLRNYFADLPAGSFPFYTSTIDRKPSGFVAYAPADETSGGRAGRLRRRHGE